ncbi:MAG: hypothetical protein AD742_15350 [Methylibium sp. NZG]|nr:MAG: hypothetical protein AD742_15350 [Methylibium sp. NZG]
MWVVGVDDDDEFEFVSGVDAGLRQEVESLFYFHPRQHALSASIRESVDRFGAPEICERGERIYIGIPRLDAQCLFACHRSRRPGVPVGVVLYLRNPADVLRILHVVAGPGYEHGGRFSQCGLAPRLVDEVRRVATRIGGVRRVALPYARERYLTVAAHLDR